MKFTFGRSRFEITITYKSGAVVSMWVTEFKFVPGESASWTGYAGQRPIDINIDAIESVHQTDAAANIFSYFFAWIGGGLKNAR